MNRLNIFKQNLNKNRNNYKFKNKKQVILVQQQI